MEVVGDERPILVFLLLDDFVRLLRESAFVEDSCFKSNIKVGAVRPSVAGEREETGEAGNRVGGRFPILND
jgi:hypothetical protein